LVGIAAIGWTDGFRSCALTDTVADWSALGSWKKPEMELKHCTIITVHTNLGIRVQAGSYAGGSSGTEALDELVVTLAASLGADSEIETVDLAGTRIGDTGAAALAAALHSNSQLNRLNLSGCGIGDEGVTALAHALALNTALIDLDLSDNDFGAEGTEALASALKHNRALQILWLFDNAIESSGAVSLAKALPEGCSLTRLGLGGIVHLHGGRKAYVHIGNEAKAELATAEAQVAQRSSGDQRFRIVYYALSLKSEDRAVSITDSQWDPSGRFFIWREHEGSDISSMLVILFPTCASIALLLLFIRHVSARTHERRQCGRPMRIGSIPMV